LTLGRRQGETASSAGEERLHNPHLVEEYLARLGVRRCDRPDDTSLRFLHAAHLRRVPFENLSVHLGEPIRRNCSPISAGVASMGRLRRAG
jgi:hypothetical protein